jgi:regulatory protein
LLFKNMGRVVTALKTQKRNPNRVNVHLDGEYAFGLSRIVAAWLTVGREMTDGEIEKLRQDDGYEEAAQVAIRYIAYKPRTTAEVRKRLQDAKYPESAIEHTITRFTETGLINDGQYARDWVEDRQVFHPRSTRQMGYELRQKGVAREDIEAALAEAGDDDQMAYQLASQKIDRYDSLDSNEFRRKLGGLLARRGFSYETVTRVINRLWSERETGITQD